MTSNKVGVFADHVQRAGVIGNDGRTLSVAVDSAPEKLQTALKLFSNAGIDLNDAGMRRPTLDDVFLNLTGHQAQEGEAAK